MTTQPTFIDQDVLQDYFTDQEKARSTFEQEINAAILHKRIFVLHGIGGIGKSSLMRMLRYICLQNGIAVALVSGDEVKDVAGILHAWAEDLKAHGVKLPAFTHTYQHYCEVIAKVQRKAQETTKSQETLSGKVTNTVVKTVTTTVIGAAANMVVPGSGPVAGAVGWVGAEALIDWLRGQGFASSDIELVRDPTRKLTALFVHDIALYAGKHRLALMLDTYEQLNQLEDWAREFTQHLHPNILLVIAGRGIPEWGRAWPNWMAVANVIELKPMTDDIMRELTKRYYAVIRGGEPDAKQVDAIIRFARGLPMVVTTAVQLWVEYGVENFETIKAEVVADLVDRLKEGVPAAVLPVFDAAAAVRWFNKEILRVLTAQPDLEDAYNELRRFPFIRSREEGLALNDTLRDMMDEYLKTHDPQMHRVLHERAVAYYMDQIESIHNEKSGELAIELLYHRVRVNEQDGIHLFQEMAEELVRHRFVSKLRTLLNDVNAYAVDTLRSANSCAWVTYYSARLAQVELRLHDAEVMYRSIANNLDIDAKLRAYAWCDLAGIWTRFEYLSRNGGEKRAMDAIQHSRSLSPKLEGPLILLLTHQRQISNYHGQWENSNRLLEQQLQIYKENNDNYGVVWTLCLLKLNNGLLGNWRGMYDAITQGHELLESMPDTPFLKTKLHAQAGWFMVWSGRWAEAEQALRDGLSANRQLGDEDLASLYFDLGFVLGMQRKYAESDQSFKDTFELFTRLGDDFVSAVGSAYGFRGAILTAQGRYEEADSAFSQSLAIKQKLVDSIGLPEVYIWMAEKAEIGKEPEFAVKWYTKSLEYRNTRRRYFECGALTGLLRVHCALGQLADAAKLFHEAEQLAVMYEYNDHLASLYLTKGHTSWASVVPDWGGGFDAVLAYYQRALVYGLRFNRFVLDDMLIGREAGTPLIPIIPYCLSHGREGRRMLSSIRNWWNTGVNDVGTQRSDTVSPIPEGIKLLQAESIAREREPGDYSVQRTVLDSLNEALA